MPDSEDENGDKSKKLPRPGNCWVCWRFDDRFLSDLLAVVSAGRATTVYEGHDSYNSFPEEDDAPQLDYNRAYGR